MRLSRSILIALTAITMLGATAETAQARRPRGGFQPAPVPPSVQPLVRLSLEQPGGVSLPGYLHHGSMFFAGQKGDRYNIRLHNNSNERLEVVITVDGRDVISGELGNYKRQRGYVVDAWSSVVIEGYRQSLDQVAAFRFSELEDSYTARLGTPSNAGVIGVAVFKESRRSARRHRKALETPPPPPPPYYEPYYEGRDASPPAAFPAAGEAEAAADDAPAPRSSRSRRQVAAAPAPRKLGTAYGESQYSAVREVPFKRKRRRRPDAFLTAYYDSAQGLVARGVSMRSAPLSYEPQPFPQPGYAAPPPPRR